MIEEICESHRKSIDLMARTILREAEKVGEDPLYDQKEGEQRKQVVANLMLAYRHMEDAAMRLGKVYQARNGGISNSTK